MSATNEWIPVGSVASLLFNIRKLKHYRKLELIFKSLDPGKIPLPQQTAATKTNLEIVIWQISH